MFLILDLLKEPRTKLKNQSHPKGLFSKDPNRKSLGYLDLDLLKNPPKK